MMKQVFAISFLLAAALVVLYAAYELLTKKAVNKPRWTMIGSVALLVVLTTSIYLQVTQTVSPILREGQAVLCLGCFAVLAIATQQRAIIFISCLVCLAFNFLQVDGLYSCQYPSLGLVLGLGVLMAFSVRKRWNSAVAALGLTTALMVFCGFWNAGPFTWEHQVSTVLLAALYCWAFFNLAVVASRNLVLSKRGNSLMQLCLVLFGPMLLAPSLLRAEVHFGVILMVCVFLGLLSLSLLREYSGRLKMLSIWPFALGLSFAVYGLC